MLELLYAKAAAAVIATLLAFIGAHTPERTAPLTWPETLANVRPMAANGDPDAAMMVLADDLMHQPGCDTWCANIALGRHAADRGDLVSMIVYVFEAYGAGHLAPLATRVMRCESGLFPGAYSGFYQGLSQQDPRYWRARAAAAGFPGVSPYDPVANAAVMAWMLASGSGWDDWPACSALVG